MRITSLFILLPLSLLCHAHGGGNYGYRVNVRMQGLGENKAIRQIYREHIKAMLND